MGFMGHLPKLWDEMGQFLKIWDLWDLWDGWEDCLTLLSVSVIPQDLKYNIEKN